MSGFSNQPGVFVATAYGEYTTNAALATAIPFDDTIPQVTEGTEIISVAITPKKTSNKIRARFKAWGTVSLGGTALIAALFRNGGANAIAASAMRVISGGDYVTITFEFEDSPASVSAQTYTVRVGSSSGSTYLNGAVGRALGGSSRATLVLEEISG